MRSKSVASVILCLSVLQVGSLSPVDAAVPTTKFKDCSALLKRYKNGVASSKAKKGKTKAAVSAGVYRSNRGLDRDKNGIVCDGGDVSGAQSWTAYELSGAGPDVKALTNPVTEPAIISFTHTGESNFAVWSLDAKLEQVDLLVNEIGNYTGTVFVSRGYSFSPTVTKQLQIEDAETWTAKVAPAPTAPVFAGKSSGTGDAVLRYGGARTRVSITHSGEGNFAVTTYSRDGFYGDLVVNEIGAFSGNVVLPSAEYIVISADGTWSLSK